MLLCSITFVRKNYFLNCRLGLTNVSLLCINLHLLVTHDKVLAKISPISNNCKLITKIFQFKGLNPKNKGHTNFYECCDLTKKSISSFLWKFLPKLFLRIICLQLLKSTNTNPPLHPLFMLKPDNKGATKKYGKTKGKSEFINYVKYLRVL